MGVFTLKIQINKIKDTKDIITKKEKNKIMSTKKIKTKQKKNKKLNRI